MLGLGLPVLDPPTLSLVSGYWFGTCTALIGLGVYSLSRSLQISGYRFCILQSFLWTGSLQLASIDLGLPILDPATLTLDWEFTDRGLPILDLAPLALDWEFTVGASTNLRLTILDPVFLSLSFWEAIV